MDHGFVLINGIAFSPDDRFMYVADSRREVVYRYDFDIEEGAIGNRRAFISTEDLKGRVDGATVAEDGSYWCAHVRGGQVAHYDPDGRLVRTIALPVSCPLMCTFGGSDLSTLFVTSSRALAGPDEPLAGSVFAIHGLPARGIAEPTFNG
jgi:sugar lactone lactonase YvrE